MPFKPVASPNNLSRLLSASRRIDVQFSLPADDLPKFCILRKNSDDYLENETANEFAMTTGCL
jgi:hypothetical protein